MGEAQFRRGERHPCVLSHPHEVLGRLLLRVGDSDGGDVPCGEHPCQQHGVAAVILHAITRGAEHLRGGADKALQPRRIERPGEREPGRTRLIDRAHWALEPESPVYDFLRSGLVEGSL